ncbi:TetR/AcrR family transcriptional regulator [Peterkaempfera griseoplana]|uniref:TetR/AcrR family transcriptional regulator n=1 Tax=Peterkaempfera griseoplana TaxID=66896 RepID=UPI0006E3AC45|nr:TetR/AcrR family transcriptional regulator [Peterkaempfera griseoplana]
MSHRPFHHGNLRAVLLEQAEAVLRERGIDALSLRELAREAGVSHGAPRSHFVDRKALLDALAERGFVRLADQIREAVSQVPADHARTLHAAASAYLRFAERDPALLDLMFATKADGPPEAVRSAAERLFGVMTGIMDAGVEAGAYDRSDVGRLTLLLSATVQGISTLVTSRRITVSQGETLIDDAISVFLRGVSAERHG